MSYLLDTNILSEFRKPHCNARVRQWGEQIDPDDCFISVLSLGEIRRGIDLIRRRDSSRAKVLDRWVNTLILSYSDRILSVDVKTALKWGSLGTIKNFSPIDALLGATAAQHDLILVTRNIADFENMGIELMNPFEI